MKKTESADYVFFENMACQCGFAELSADGARQGNTARGSSREAAAAA